MLLLLLNTRSKKCKVLENSRTEINTQHACNSNLLFNITCSAHMLLDISLQYTVIYRYKGATETSTFFKFNITFCFDFKTCIDHHVYFFAKELK